MTGGIDAIAACTGRARQARMSPAEYIARELRMEYRAQPACSEREVLVFEVEEVSYLELDDVRCDVVSLQQPYSVVPRQRVTPG